MNLENKKLGRGLGSLLSKTVIKKDQNFKLVNLSEIKANPNQPRKNFKKNELQDLANSIKSQGILQPIVLSPLKNGFHEIIAGERRWRAAQISGIHQIPALIKDLSEESTRFVALIENIQRENLNAIEEARAYQIMITDNNLDYDKIGRAVGKSKSHISNTLRLLELEDKILELVISGDLSMGHARALIGVPNAIDLAYEIIKKKLSVRQTEHNTKKFKKTKNKKKYIDPNILDLEKELSEKIGLKTSIHFNEGSSSGSLTLFYSDLDQLDGIMRRLKNK